jgi:hypothetical protein
MALLRGLLINENKQTPCICVGADVCVSRKEMGVKNYTRRRMVKISPLGPHGWRSGLRVRAQALSQLAATGRSMGLCTIGLASSGFVMQVKEDPKATWRKQSL